MLAVVIPNIKVVTVFFRHYHHFFQTVPDLTRHPAHFLSFEYKILFPSFFYTQLRQLTFCIP